MADINQPKEFLQEALSLVDALDSDREQQRTLSQNSEELEKVYETLAKNINKEKTDTINSRRADKEEGFDKQIKAAAREIDKLNQKRQKAREEGVRNRVETQTEGFRQQESQYREQLIKFCNDNKLPGMLKSGLYYSLFCPASAGDWALVLFIVLIMIALIMAAFFTRKILWMLLAVAVIVLIAVIYVAVWNQTKGKHPDEVKFCKGKIAQIRGQKKEIKRTSSAIRKDKDDSVYDLSSYDAEISAASQKKANLENQKTAALYQFDNITKQELIAEIDNNYAERLKAAADTASQAKTELAAVSQRVSDAESSLNQNFIQYLGGKNMNHAAISKMIELVTNGEAASVSDAVSKLASMGQ